MLLEMLPPPIPPTAPLLVLLPVPPPWPLLVLPLEDELSVLLSSKVKSTGAQPAAETAAYTAKAAKTPGADT